MALMSNYVTFFYVDVIPYPYLNLNAGLTNLH